MKIYTKTGDKGKTSLVGGQRVPKCCNRIESYGTVDELNSHIGLLITYCKDEKDISTLKDIQSRLFTLGAYLATDNTQQEVQNCIITNNMISVVENEIDRLQSLLPELHFFILPGGSQGASCAHICRTVCRRAERCMLRLLEDGIVVDDNALAYVNRLSDYFFVVARKLNRDAGIEDVAWKNE